MKGEHSLQHTSSSIKIISLLLQDIQPPVYSCRKNTQFCCFANLFKFDNSQETLLLHTCYCQMKIRFYVLFDLQIMLWNQTISRGLIFSAWSHHIKIIFANTIQFALLPWSQVGCYSGRMTQEVFFHYLEGLWVEQQQATEVLSHGSDRSARSAQV